MASKTEIANLAISHLGIGKEIANIENEQSQEAAACRRFYETAKEATLSDLDWSFATKEAVLNLIEETPEGEWLYKYIYPSDCVNMRRIVSGFRVDTQSTRLPFKVSSEGTQKVIITDKEDASAEYTRNVNDPNLFSAEFTLALSFRLASYIAPRLTGGDPFKMKEEMLLQYELELGKAKKKNMNEETPDTKPESEFITTRR